MSEQAAGRFIGPAPGRLKKMDLSHIWLLNENEFVSGLQCQSRSRWAPRVAIHYRSLQAGKNDGAQVECTAEIET